MKPARSTRPLWKNAQNAWSQALIGSCLFGALLSPLGCAQMPKMPWAGDRTPKELPGPNTLAGRVAAVELIGQRATEMESGEAKRVVEAWADQWASPDTMPVPVKTAVLHVAPQLPNGQGAAILPLALRDAEIEVRQHACRAAGMMPSRENMDLLIDLLTHESNTDVRLSATRALGQFKDPQVISTLGQLLDDRDPAIQYLAMQSLENATGEDGGLDVRQWKKMLEQPSSLTASEASDKLRR